MTSFTLSSEAMIEVSSGSNGPDPFMTQRLRGCLTLTFLAFLADLPSSTARRRLAISFSRSSSAMVLSGIGYGSRCTEGPRSIPVVKYTHSAWNGAKGAIERAIPCKDSARVSYAVFLIAVSSSPQNLRLFTLTYQLDKSSTAKAWIAFVAWKRLLSSM